MVHGGSLALVRLCDREIAFGCAVAMGDNWPVGFGRAVLEACLVDYSRYNTFSRR